MTNEEKSKEIAQNNRINYYEGDIGWSDRIKSSEEECYDSAMEMAEWKDKQYKEREDGLRETINMLDARLQKANDSVMYYFDQCNIQKQQLIDNVCEWLKNHIDDYMMTGEGEFLDSFDEMYEDLKKEIKK